MSDRAYYNLLAALWLTLVLALLAANSLQATEWGACCVIDGDYNPIACFDTWPNGDSISEVECDSQFPGLYGGRYGLYAPEHACDEITCAVPVVDALPERWLWSLAGLLVAVSAGLVRKQR